MNKTLTVLAFLLLLSGCVNVHVHFPPATADKDAGESRNP